MNFQPPIHHRFSILCICMLGANLYAQSPAGRNPLVTDAYSADPSAHVFHDTLWVYPSHDRSNANTFDMEDYHVYSTTDMIHWKDHGVIFSPFTQTSWAKTAAWAPDCVERNGKFYLYFPTDKRHIGVAVSNRPDGPFTEPLGHPLLSIDSPGVICDRDFIDPCVFIDDDGQAYMYVGQNTPCAIKLNDDMISYDGEVHILEGIPDFFEAAWMHKAPRTKKKKKSSTYYFSYSDGPFHGHLPRIAYCTSDNPLGPFTYQGVILPPVNSGTNHHSIVEYQGQSWLFYHNADLSLYNSPFDHTGVRRSIAADHIYYNEDGTIQVVKTTHDIERIKGNTAAEKSGEVHLLSGQVKVSGSGILYYEECGEGTPLILLHGHSLDRRMWDLQLPALASHYRVIRIDARGYGLSSDQVEGEAFTHVEDLIAVMDTLKIDKAHIVGLSMGSFIAGDMLAMYPERMLSCTLASGGIRAVKGPNQPDTKLERDKKEASIQAILESGLENYKKKWIEVLIASGGSQREKMRKAITRMVNDWTGWQATHREYHCYYGIEAMEALRSRQPEVPTLFLRGANEWKEGQRISMMDHLPNSRIVIIPDCGHMLNMDQPEAFNRTLIEFLSSVNN